MNHQLTRKEVTLVRIASIRRYTRYLQSVGEPVERMLQHAGIPVPLLDHPAAAVPMQSAFRFGELACRKLGTEHLGLHVGLATVSAISGPSSKHCRAL